MRRDEKTERQRAWPVDRPNVKYLLHQIGMLIGKATGLIKRNLWRNVQACLVAARVVVNASKVAPSEVRATLPVPLRPALGVRRECWQSRVIPHETDRRPGSPWKSVDPAYRSANRNRATIESRACGRTVVFGAAEGDALRPTVVAAEESGFCHRDQRLRVRDGE